MKRKIYWTKERCYRESLKYKTKQDFKLKAAGAYTAARRNNWLEEIWANFKPIGNLYKRCIYVYEFPDKSVYVGLTYSLNSRDKRHVRNHKNNKSLVFKHIKKTKLKPLLKKITDYVDVVEASKLEGEIIESYKNKGWDILNKKKAGSLGGNVFIWTKSNCINIAKKCKSRNEFLKKYHGAYCSAKKYGWLNEIYKYLKPINKPKGYWTKKRCKMVSKKCKMKEEFRKKYSSAYTISIKNGWFKEICSHMKKRYDK